MDGKKVWKKTGFGILFVSACFIAMYILMEFHGDVLMVSLAAALLLISAFLFMNAVFTDKAKKWIPQEEETEEFDAPVSSAGDKEFHLKVTKHMKEMESTQKELIEVLKNQNTLIQAQIENLEHEIYMLSEKQANQTKSIIKFNKENARQLAISERETLEYVMMELKKSIEDNAGAPVERAVAATSETPQAEPEVMQPLVEETITEEPVVEVPTAEEPVAPVLEDVSEAELFEVSDLPGDDEYEIPEMPEDVDLSELFDIPELLDTPEEEVSAEEPVAEAVPAAEEKQEEPAPAADPLAGLTNDPNAMMTPEDIAKLLESMGQ